MNDTALTVTPSADIIEQVIVAGDLARLSPQQRSAYYVQTCKSLGINPLTRPFEYIVLNGKMTLYARRDCTDQLRKIHRVATAIVSRERIEDIYVVTTRGTLPDGRTDESIGAVSIKGLQGDALANALMKAETKSKRRVTLSIVGLGWLDETEVETVPSAQRVPAEIADPSMPAPEPLIDTSWSEVQDAPNPRTVIMPPMKPETAAALERAVKLPIIKTPLWASLGAELCRQTPHFADDKGRFNGAHALNALAKIPNHPDVIDGDNVTVVMGMLLDYANKQ